MAPSRLNTEGPKNHYCCKSHASLNEFMEEHEAKFLLELDNFSLGEW